MRDLREKPRVTLVFTDLTLLDSLGMAVNTQVEQLHDLMVSSSAGSDERTWAAKHLERFKQLEQRISDAATRLESKIHT